MWAAPKEVKWSLDNLRSELYGERDYFKEAIKSSKSKRKGAMRSHTDVSTLKILNDSVKHMMRQFRKLEEPFLEEPPSEKEIDVEKIDHTVRGDYVNMGLVHRYIWLRSKSDVIMLADQVTRLQTRRLAFDTGCVLS